MQISSKHYFYLLCCFPLTKINECNEGTHNCDTNADCANTQEGFTCTCKSGHTGSGTSGNCGAMISVLSVFVNCLIVILTEILVIFQLKVEYVYHIVKNDEEDGFLRFNNVSIISKYCFGQWGWRKNLISMTTRRYVNKVFVLRYLT